MDSSTQANQFFNNQVYQPISGTELTLVTWQLKTPENVGSIIRTAANMGASRLIMVLPEGITYKTYKYERVAGAALNQLTIIETNTHDVWQHIPNDCQTVALETSANSTNIFATPLPVKMALLLGNEQKGLPADVIERCQSAIHIPMPGNIKSMNVSHATSVAVFEWYRQMAYGSNVAITGK